MAGEEELCPARRKNEIPGKTGALKGRKTGGIQSIHVGFPSRSKQDPGLQTGFRSRQSAFRKSVPGRSDKRVSGPVREAAASSSEGSPSIRIDPPPMLRMRLLPISFPSFMAVKSMVLGCGRFLSSRLNRISAFGSADRIAFPVPCPSPVKARDPYKTTRYVSASG